MRHDPVTEPPEGPLAIAMVSLHANPLAAGSATAQEVSQHVAHLAAGLVGLGHDVVVYTRRSDPDSPAEQLSGTGFRVVNLDAGPARPLSPEDSHPYVGEFTDRMRAHWTHSPPDVVHAHFWLSGLAAVLAARETGVRVVQTFHEFARGSAPGAAQRAKVERMVALAVDHVITPTSSRLAHVVRMGVPRPSITVVPSGVDTTTFRPDGPRAERGLPHRLVVPGEPVARSGFATALRAASTLPETEVVMIGAGLHSQDGTALRALVHDLGLTGRVHLTGPGTPEERAALLRSADVVVCPQQHDGFCIPAIEAMSCGVPVVAAPVGGLADTVVDQVTGVHLSQHTPRELAMVLRPLLGNPGMREQLGVAGRDRAVHRYDSARVAAEAELVYRGDHATADIALPK
ncbi:glycosyltransferase [Actinokineospora bangkokensis]|uniref:Glycosyl transferase n=1 Tax=Actinokineospora bangkokensis TaxID=1193682 RepID=A0A1Q9LLS8_9PSEU|nr:glycosyltransferase [Actinokineospora bangkokensis]OLR92954.1 hypothetical protein BJP25_18465 [Actinokineospora bangkokensis]